MSTIYKMALYDDSLTVYPGDALVRGFLTLQTRSMVNDGWKSDIVEEPMLAFKSFGDSPDSAVQTYPGFWRSLKEYLEIHGLKVEVLNYVRNRKPYKPELIGSTRFSQAQLLHQALCLNYSGLIGAPTRYGKSFVMSNLVKMFPGVKTLITAPGLDLVEQLYQHFKKELPLRNVVWLGTGKGRVKTQGDDITICSIDSLHKCDYHGTRLLLVDEPHASVSDGRIFKVNNFKIARRYGFGATLRGRFDRKDRLIEGLFGPVLAERTYLEAVAEGAICPIKVLMIKVPFHWESNPSGRRENAMKIGLYKNEQIATILQYLHTEGIPPEWQAVYFVSRSEQGEFLQEKLEPKIPIAMAKLLTSNERAALTSSLQDGSLRRALVSNIYVQGVTFSDLMALVNLSGGGGSTSSIQKPGRLAEVRPGKRFGVMIDFMFDIVDRYEMPPTAACSALPGESWARLREYERIGYDIIHVDDYKDVKEIIQTTCQ